MLFSTNPSTFGLALALSAAALGLGAGCGSAIENGSPATSSTGEGLTASCGGVTVASNKTDNDYCGTITVKNASTTTVHSWTVDFDLPAGVAVDYIDSGATYKQTGSHVQIVRASTLAASASYSVTYCNSNRASLLAQSPVAKSDLCSATSPAPSATTTATTTTTPAPAPAAPPPAPTTVTAKSPLGQYVMTWYSFQDNTPVNSGLSASGRKLIPYISVALPFRYLKAFGGKIAYGDQLYIDYLAGRVMPNGTKHTGWVQVDDFCGDSGDDSYCFQTVYGVKHPNVDLYIGDFTKSGMSPSTCSGPAGSGQELTNVSTGAAGAAWVGDYGARALGTGKCGVLSTAKPQQGSCWDYTPPASSASECASCTGSSCTSW